MKKYGEKIEKYKITNETLFELFTDPHNNQGNYNFGGLTPV